LKPNEPTMEVHLPDWLWPIAFFGGLGVFIDFLVGKAGQARCKAFLELWWLRFADVTWSNLGRKELEFLLYLLDSWFGRALFTVRRWLAALFLFLFICVGIFLNSFMHGLFAYGSQFLFAVYTNLFNAPIDWFLAIVLPSVAHSIVGIAFTISVIRLSTLLMIRLCPHPTSAR
jgi:hypothetical protein